MEAIELDWNAGRAFESLARASGNLEGFGLSGVARAAVIGSGPNGLSAAIRLAQAGLAVRVYEARETIGGAARTGEITLPGFHHDLGSSIYPMGVASPFLKTLPLEKFGLRWIEPAAPLAHPLDDGSAVTLENELEATAEGLDSNDRAAYLRLMQPLVAQWEALAGEVLGPLIHVPRHPLLLARFGMFAALPATVLAKTLFRGPRARALFAGNAAHSVLPLESFFSAAVGLVLGAAGHATGWPVAAGGAQAISDAMGGYLKSLGGEIVTAHGIADLADIEEELVMADLSPRGLSRIGWRSLPSRYLKRMEKYRYGPGAFKLDWALSEPIPWKAKECLRAATVHVCGTMEEVAHSEREAWNGQGSFARLGLSGLGPSGRGFSKQGQRPFVLVAQPSLFDPSRAPVGKHTAWGYCHVPNGFAGTMVDQIELQVERFAPGFRDCILARRVTNTADFEAWNANLVGGDLSGGAMTFGQLVFRPSMSLYRTPKKGLYLCSASTPPGGGVHGMCGYHAANAALRDLKLI